MFRSPLGRGFHAVTGKDNDTESGTAGRDLGVQGGNLRCCGDG